jgi:Single-strand binding protein family
MSIDVALFGALTREPERKTSAAGRAYLRFNVRVGSGDGAQFANVMVFNDIDELARTLAKDGKVYIEGALSAEGMDRP